MTTSSGAVNKRLSDHSKKIAVIDERQQEYYKLLMQIDKKLSPDFFTKVEAMYEFVIVGNGVSSLKSWRNEVDGKLEGIQTRNTTRDAEETSKEKDLKAERRKWIYGLVIFSLGVLTNIIFVKLGIP